MPINQTTTNNQKNFKLPKFLTRKNKKDTPPADPYRQVKNHTRAIFEKHINTILGILNEPNPTGEKTTEIIIFDDKIKTETRAAPAVSMVTEDNLLFVILVKHKPEFKAAELWEILEAHLELFIVELDAGLTTAPAWLIPKK